MKKIGRLEIDWIAFNQKLDNLDGVIKQPTSYNWPLKTETYENNYKVDDHVYSSDYVYTEYVSDDFIEYFPMDFWAKVGMDGQVIIKVLEHLPGILTMPHLDGYHLTKDKFGLDPDAPVKRLWIPCMDYKFGHIVCVGDGPVMDNYKAGDVYVIPGDVLHSAGNIGVEKRRIITVTGAAKDGVGFKGVEVC